MIGMKQVMSSGSRQHAAYRKNGVFGLRDTRIENAGRTLERAYVRRKVCLFRSRTKLTKGGK